MMGKLLHLQAVINNSDFKDATLGLQLQLQAFKNVTPVVCTSTRHTVISKNTAPGCDNLPAWLFKKMLCRAG